MSDTHPADQFCTLCPDRERIPHYPPVCDACRSWLAGMIGDIRIRYEELTTDPVPVVDIRAVVVLNPAGQLVPLHDPIIISAPAALVPGEASGPRVTTVPNSRPPLPLDVVDLTSAARLPNPVRGPGHYPRNLWPEDQIGHQPVATILDQWVRDWISLRGQREHLPVARVEVLTRWLADRVEWACDHHRAVDEFASEMRSVRSALLGALGHWDGPTRKDGPCPKCDTVDLLVRNGSEWIECGSCDALMSSAEYAEWTKTLAQQYRPAA
jgi:hypothetical protein